MDLTVFKEELISEKIIFNELKKEEFDEFYTEFTKMSANDKEFLLVEIIDFENENNLSEKNYLTLFGKDGMEDILRNIL
jgi:hypothetical protein